MKKHLLTIRNAGKVFTFLVPARTDADGKTRMSQALYNICLKKASGTRGHCVMIG